MPYYDSAKGISAYKDDACRGCDLVGACNVITSLNIEQDKSEYHEVHIVPVGHGADRDNYLECQSYKPWIDPNDRPDKDPLFGRRLSQQEADIMANPKRPLPEKF